MRVTSIGLMVLMTLALLHGPLPVGADDNSVADCPASILDALSGSSSQSEPESAGSDQEDAVPNVFPTYDVCDDSVQGGCIVSETVDVTATSTGGLKPFKFEAYAKTNVNVDVKTYVHCEGVAEATIVHSGGAGIRTVESTMGGADPGLDQEPDHCTYLAPAQLCETEHEIPFTADAVLAGRLVSGSGGLTVCGSLDINNGQGAGINSDVTRAAGIITDNHHWAPGICEYLTFEVADSGRFLLLDQEFQLF